MASNVGENDLDDCQRSTVSGRGRGCPRRSRETSGRPRRSRRRRSARGDCRIHDSSRFLETPPDAKSAFPLHETHNGDQFSSSIHLLKIFVSDVSILDYDWFEIDTLDVVLDE